MTATANPGGGDALVAGIRHWHGPSAHAGGERSVAARCRGRPSPPFDDSLEWGGRLRPSICLELAR
jgi:hypothetical protein